MGNTHRHLDQGRHPAPQSKTQVSSSATLRHKAPPSKGTHAHTSKNEERKAGGWTHAEHHDRWRVRTVADVVRNNKPRRPRRCRQRRLLRKIALALCPRKWHQVSKKEINNTLFSPRSGRLAGGSCTTDRAQRKTWGATRAWQRESKAVERKKEKGCEFGHAPASREQSSQRPCGRHHTASSR